MIADRCCRYRFAKQMNFEKFFRLISYAAVFCGFLALWVSGSFGAIGSALFTIGFVLAWFLEDTRWQIPERPGTVLIVLAVPLYYIGWRSGFFDLSGPESRLPVTLAYLILSLTVVKLFQKKSDRDWVFLYLMAFFEVLLGAGLSISALYLASFVTFVFLMACVMLAFEMRKSAGKSVDESQTGKASTAATKLDGFRSRRIPFSATILVACIVLLAAPLFFFLPRVGGAGMGSGRERMATSGFSDTVRLGDIGTIQQSDEIVMRVRITKKNEMPDFIRWRGVGLDTFENNSWRRSSQGVAEQLDRRVSDLIQVDSVANRNNLVQQTIYLEPLDRPVLFGLPRIVGVQSAFPTLRRDTEGGITFPQAGSRVSYTVLSDTTRPTEQELRSDNELYTAEYGRYLELPPKVDPRIGELAKSVTARTQNRYDAARTVEKYLQTQFGYTLDLKAGGPDPLSDFLFNVREGHCEYFATAMAVMLRTQGVATRVVNGFQAGEYNDAADAFVVRQRNAHSWVEVYFPREDVWMPFDPTPYAGQNLTPNYGGIAASFNKYLEALEIVWIQYFVAFDNQEQRSLFTSMKRRASDLNSATNGFIASLRREVAEWWRLLSGGEGLAASLYSFGSLAAYLAVGLFAVLLVVWLLRRLIRSHFWRAIAARFRWRRRASIVAFYEELETILAHRGYTRLPHQTPLEFATSVGIPAAATLVSKYNQVRFGNRLMRADEKSEIEALLGQLAG